MSFNIINRNSEQERLKGESLCWYVAYGSNLYFERFNLYLWGGKSSWPDKEYGGCRWPSHPIENNAFTSIRNELYFAKSSKTWKGGGVAFIKNKESDNDNLEVVTYCRGYLIKKHQFVDLVKQENGWKAIPDIDFDNVHNGGSLILPKSGWYNKISHLGYVGGYPCYTILPEKDWDDDDINEPWYFYLRYIVLGLYQGFNLSPDIINQYINRLEGIRDREDSEKIKRDINDIFSKNCREIDAQPKYRCTPYTRST